MPSDREPVSDNNIENFVTETINDSTIYINLGLTLASALAWGRAGEHIMAKFKTPQGPVYNAIFLTLITIFIFRMTSNRSKKRY